MKKIKVAATQWGFPGSGIFSARLASEAGLDGVQLDFGSYDEGLGDSKT